ncbi:MAG: adenylate/guanylate cyclase domain-containing protein [Psychroserpens sp.]|uniref:adenylate/guanylate cyclase domain-containing protein n=1 Tax=Psychroserpens sp. TaxID=2020870 RepID=UPI003003523C
MKSKWLYFIFSLIFTITNAQTNLDSLYTVWEDQTQPDSSRIKALDDYIWFGYVYSDPDKAIILSDTLFEFSKKRGKKKVMASALNMKGMAYYNKSDFPNALKQHKSSLIIQNEIGNKYGIASSLNNIGMIYRIQGDYINALDYYQRSVNIHTETENKLGIAKSENNIGNVYIELGDYINALNYYQRSLNIYDEIDAKDGIVNTLNNIGLCYKGQDDYKKAQDFFQNSLQIAKETGDEIGTARASSNIGDIYLIEQDYSNALDNYQYCLNTLEKIGNKYGVALSLANIGSIYRIQNNYSKAILNCKKSHEIAKEIEAIAVQKMACECLYTGYKALGNGNIALLYHEQMLVLNDSLKTEDAAKKLQQMEFSKQVLADSLVQVEKELKVEMAHQTEVRKKDKNKDLAIGAGIFFLLLSGGFFSRWRYVKKSKAVIEKEKDRSENLLLNILPSEIAEELKEKGSADAKDFEMVSILFTDFKGFTQASEKLSAKALIEEINVCFKAFDYICESHGIEKIKTIGDAYMAAGGLPVPSEDSLKNTVLAALEMQSFISNRIIEKDELNEMSFKMRLGIHTGPVVAGIVGVKKFQYDIWGDTVNTASRMESSGEIGKVNISEGTYILLKDDPEFTFESRGKIQAKGKGEMEMYFVETKLQ